ncbi:MAG: hypothetical protein ACLUFV_03590 [Acutalibacteraceae bacterium]
MLLPDADLDALRRLEAETGISCADASFASSEVLEAVRAGRTQGVPELDSEQLRRALGSLPSLSFSDVVRALGLLRGTGALPEDLPLSEALAYRDDVFLRIQRRTEVTVPGSPIRLCTTPPAASCPRWHVRFAEKAAFVARA